MTSQDYLSIALLIAVLYLVVHMIPWGAAMYGDIEMIGVVPKDAVNEESTMESQSIARANRSLQAADPPLAASQRSRAFARSDRRCYFHSRASSRSRRSSYPKVIGRPRLRGARKSHVAPQVERQFALLHAGEGARQGYGDSGGRPEPTRAPTSGNVRGVR